MKNSLMTAMLIIFCLNVMAQNKPVVRMAKLRIDTAQLDAYKAILKEEMATSVRIEPGVLSLSAVSDKNDKSIITILEVYADDPAYRAHLETPHFKKYKISTRDMVKSLELVEVDPVMLATKQKE